MANQICSVAAGILETESGKKIKLYFPEWLEWLHSNDSFRYCPSSPHSPFTVRKEKSSRGKADYWYGYRKVSGKLHKRYIGKTGDLSSKRLEEIAEELNIPATPRSKPQFTEQPDVTDTEETTRLHIQVEELQNQLAAKSAELELVQQKLEKQRSHRIDYQAIQENYLSSLKLGKQASEYKNARRHLNGFTTLLKAKLEASHGNYAE